MRWWVVVVTAGCAEGTVGTTPQRVWDGEFLIDEVIIDCDGSREWTYDVWTLGWGEEVTVDVVARQYGALLWNEHHSLPEIEYGEDWAHHQVVLDQVTDEEEVVSGASTWFACDGKTYLTYGIASWRFDGEMEECVAWGLDPVGEFPDCANWGENGH